MKLIQERKFYKVQFQTGEFDMHLIADTLQSAILKCNDIFQRIHGFVAEIKNIEEDDTCMFYKDVNNGNQDYVTLNLYKLYYIDGDRNKMYAHVAAVQFDDVIDIFQSNKAYKNIYKDFQRVEFLTEIIL
jgi:hypothetical protein